jgi:ribonuclease D
MAEPVYCTKIASRLARTYTDKHGLAGPGTRSPELMYPNSSSSPTGAPKNLVMQVAYAATDVLHLHALRKAGRHACA